MTKIEIKESTKPKSPCCRVDIIEYPEYKLHVCSFCKSEVKPYN